MTHFRTFVLLLVVASWSAQALAQDDPATGSEEASAERDCIPASEAEQSSDAESGPDVDGGLPICPEQDSPESSDEQGDSAREAPDPEEQPGEGPGDDIDDEEFGREFEPTDEISEDYPVPLPSDI